MQNENVKFKIIFPAVFFFIILFCHTANAADHTHFDTEKVKPRVVFYESYRTQTTINRDWYNFDNIQPGSANAAWYNTNIDGAALPIRYNVGVGELRNLQTAQSSDTFGFAPVGGSVWVQYEIYFQQNFLDWAWVNNNFAPKVFRVFAPKAQGACPDGEDRLMTVFWVNWLNDCLMWETYCGTCNDQTQIRPGYKPLGDRWLRFTDHYDFTQKKLDVWATDLLTGNTQQLISCSSMGYDGTEKIKAADPTIHLSSGSQPGGPHPDFFIGYRNIIVSTQQIALTTGLTPPDTTPPAAPKGLSVR